MIFINSHRIKHWLSADPVKGNRNALTVWNQGDKLLYDGSRRTVLAGDVEVFQYRNIVDRNVEYSLGNRYLLCGCVMYSVVMFIVTWLLAAASAGSCGLVHEEVLGLLWDMYIVEFQEHTKQYINSFHFIVNSATIHKNSRFGHKNWTDLLIN